MKWIAMEINTFLAKFDAFGPFATEQAAQEHVNKQKHPREWCVLPLKATT